jgi:hypothetical protein
MTPMDDYDFFFFFFLFCLIITIPGKSGLIPQAFGLGAFDEVLGFYVFI